MSGSGLVIAIVDDEECVRKALGRLLQVVGFKVSTFASGEEFLYSLRVRRPDCAILDLHLPGLSGLDIQQYLRRNGNGLPCIIITGRDEARTSERVLASGAKGYLTKPLDQQALLETISAAVGSSSENGQRVSRPSCETNRTPGLKGIQPKGGNKERAGGIKSVNAREEVLSSVDK
jgi:FixJ family two-component response regulator